MEHKLSAEDKKENDNIIRTTSLLDGKSESRQIKFKSYKRVADNRSAKISYLWKPLGFIMFGSVLICCGIILTTFHFLYEVGPSSEQTAPPFFTFGPIALASGFVAFMVGIIWFSMKLHKWNTGSATPISRAMAAAVQLAANTAFTEKVGMVPKSL